MFKLHCHCLVTVNRCHFDICGVVHVNSTKEVRSPEAYSQIKTQQTYPFILKWQIKLTLFCDFLFMVSHFCFLKPEPLSPQGFAASGGPTNCPCQWHVLTVGWEGKAAGSETPQNNLVRCWLGHSVCVCFSNTCISDKKECLKSRHSNVISSMKMKERVSLQQQHFFIQLTCNLRCIRNDQKPYSYLKINYHGGLCRKDMFMHFPEVHNTVKTVSLTLQLICTALYYFKLYTVICIRVYFHSQRVSLPVLVRTLIIASNPVFFSMSFLRSLKNCGLSASS